MRIDARCGYSIVRLASSFQIRMIIYIDIFNIVSEHDIEYPFSLHILNKMYFLSKDTYLKTKLENHDFWDLKYMISRDQIIKYHLFPLFKKVKKNHNYTYLKTKNAFFLDFNYLRKTSRNGITKFPENESFLRPPFKHLYFHYSQFLWS